MANDKIIIKGAREHNLKNINLTLPREKLIVMTGLSGSGKSSLAFDTIYADGQRRYVESLSSYARMFLGRMDKPDVDEITGLSPAISIDQKTTSHTPGETFDVTVTFPDGYSDSTDSEGNTVVLSGKKAVFSVTLNYISEKVLPELTDAWVAENYGESDDVHTVEELKALYQKMLYNTNLQNAIMDDLLANSTFKERF